MCLSGCAKHCGMPTDDDANRGGRPIERRGANDAAAGLHNAERSTARFVGIAER